MERARQRWHWLLGIAALLAGAGVLPAAAQVMVRPARIEARVEDGMALPPIEITNRGTGPVRVVAYTGLGGHDLHGRPVVRDDGAARAESSRYLRLLQDELYLAPGDTAALGATVHVPAGFSGGLYPVIFVEVHPLEGTGPGAVQAIGRVAVLTLLSTGGGEAAIHAEEAVVRPGPGAGAVEVAVRVRNQGDVHVWAAGTVTIADGTGAPVAHIPLTPGTVLPGLTRELAAHWLPPATAQGPYVATVHLDPPVGSPPLQVVFQLDPAPALADAGGSGR